jgi:alpha-tubulin suppressor-like RCC1 family protein
VSSNVIAIAAGGFHSLFLKSDGRSVGHGCRLVWRVGRRQLRRGPSP